MCFASLKLCIYQKTPQKSPLFWQEEPSIYWLNLILEWYDKNLQELSQILSYDDKNFQDFSKTHIWWKFPQQTNLHSPRGRHFEKRGGRVRKMIKDLATKDFSLKVRLRKRPKVWSFCHLPLRLLSLCLAFSLSDGKRQDFAPFCCLKPPIYKL